MTTQETTTIYLLMNRDFQDDTWNESNCGYCDTHTDDLSISRLHDPDDEDASLIHSILHNGLPRDLVDEIIEIQSQLASLHYHRQKPNTIDEAVITDPDDRTIELVEGGKVFTELVGENERLFQSSSWDEITISQVTIEAQRLQDEWYREAKSYLSREKVKTGLEEAVPLYHSWIDAQSAE